LRDPPTAFSNPAVWRTNLLRVPNALQTIDRPVSDRGDLLHGATADVD